MENKELLVEEIIETLSTICDKYNPYICISHTGRIYNNNSVGVSEQSHRGNCWCITRYDDLKLPNGDKCTIEQLADEIYNRLWQFQGKPSTHGGKREGSGRPPTDRRQRNIMASDAEWELIKKYADEVRGK